MCINNRPQPPRSKLLAASLPARGLWVSAEIWLSEYGTGDTVPGYVLAALGGTEELTGELVCAGLWLATGDGIRFPGERAPAFNRNLEPDPAASEEPSPSTGRTSGARRMAMSRIEGLRAGLRARDADRCRYCARKVRWGKGRAADSAVWDWLEPDGPASPENVVTACKACAEAKDGRSLKESGMLLLDPPAPGKRTNSRDASDLRKDGRDASCGASEGVRNAYPPIDRSKSDHDLDQSSRPVEQQPLKPDARTRKARPRTQEFRLHVIAAFAAKTKIEITAQQTDDLAAEVLAHVKGRCPSPLGYVLTAIGNEDDPIGRWLPGYAPPVLRKSTAPEWCGTCDKTDRSVWDEQAAGLRWCPACNPKSLPAWERHNLAPVEAIAS